jgi:hypothetical protein
MTLVDELKSISLETERKRAELNSVLLEIDELKYGMGRFTDMPTRAKEVELINLVKLTQDLRKEINALDDQHELISNAIERGASDE